MTRHRHDSLPSDAEQSVLEILNGSAESLLPAQLAEQLWPQARGWDVVSGCGNRNTARRGGQMGAAAGTILWRLHRRGLVTYDYYHGTRRRWWISRDGQQLLRELHVI